MEAQRIFQTTLVHALRPEFSVAALFLNAELPAGTSAELLCRSLGIEPLSGGEISHDEFRRVLACRLNRGYFHCQPVVPLRSGCPDFFP